MNLLDWLLIKTPDGSTYLQVLVIFAILFFLAKYFLFPDLKKIQNIYKGLQQGDDSNDESTDNIERVKQ